MELEMRKPPNIFEALLRVQNEIRSPKNQTNDFGGFKFRSAEGMLGGIKPVLDRHGLVLTLSEKTTMVGDWHYVECTATLTLVADPSQVISVTASARESETRAKMDAAQITGGATSYARKYAMGGLFCIDSGESDPDATNRYGRDDPKAAAAPKTPRSGSMACSDCGQPIKDEVVGGKLYDWHTWARGSTKAYGHPLCMSCYMKRRKADEAAKTAS